MRSFYFVRFKWEGKYYEAAVEITVDVTDVKVMSPDDLVKKIIDEALIVLGLEEASYEEIEITNISKLL